MKMPEITILKRKKDKSYEYTFRCSEHGLSQSKPTTDAKTVLIRANSHNKYDHGGKAKQNAVNLQQLKKVI
jgi:hypothetical protein